MIALNSDGERIQSPPVLSICIPTFNRAGYLQKTLQSIVAQPGFAESCEIVISDNHSTDATGDVVAPFLSVYKNIRYYRNETNIGADRNFLQLLSLGRGVYLKLNSDKTCFCEDRLPELVQVLEKSHDGVVFVLNENDAGSERGAFECGNFDEFLHRVSYWSTWMDGIILRNEPYQALQDKGRAAGTNLIQTEIMFRMLSQGGASSIINKKMLCEQEVESKSGYNLFEVFVANYLGLCRSLVVSGALSRKAYGREKINLLRKFIFPWYTKTLVMKDKRYRFDLSKAHGIIMKHYWNEPQLLLYPMVFLKNFFLDRSAKKR